MDSSNVESPSGGNQGSLPVRASAAYTGEASVGPTEQPSTSVSSLTSPGSAAPPSLPALSVPDISASLNLTAAAEARGSATPVPTTTISPLSLADYGSSLGQLLLSLPFDGWLASTCLLLKELQPLLQRYGSIAGIRSALETVARAASPDRLSPDPGVESLLREFGSPEGVRQEIELLRAGLLHLRGQLTARAGLLEHAESQAVLLRSKRTELQGMISKLEGELTSERQVHQDSQRQLKEIRRQLAEAQTRTNQEVQRSVTELQAVRSELQAARAILVVFVDCNLQIGVRSVDPIHIGQLLGLLSSILVDSTYQLYLASTR